MNQARLGRLTAVTLAFTLLSAAAAFADTLHLDHSHSVGGDEVYRTGRTNYLAVTTGTSAVLATVEYQLQAQGGCDVSSAAPATLSLDGLPAGVTIVDGSVFETCSDTTWQEVELSIASTVVAGDYAVTPKLTPEGFNYHNNSGFTLRVTDGTPPIITETVTPSTPNGDNGWYKTGNVTVTFSVSDPNSPVSFKSAPCDATTTFNTDSGSHSVTCSATSSGGTGSKTVNIKRDVTAPVVAIASHVDGATPTETAITVTGTASDVTSGLASVVVKVGGTSYATTIDSATGTWATAVGALLLACGVPTTITAEAKDNAGNTTTSSSVTVTRDCAPIDPVVRDWKDAPAIANELIKSSAVTCGKGQHGKGISAVAHWAETAAGDKENFDTLAEWRDAVKAALTAGAACA